MDGLSRLGFIAAELLLKAEGAASSDRRSDRAVILFNHSSSIAADLKYQESINDTDNFFPSPSVFVYTLPNIVTGEIAIRHQYCGETSFYILPDKDEEQMKAIIHASFGDIETKSMLTGWVNYDDKTHFEAELNIIEI
jgi:3-oxoacyl-[acyl-carrier-protein] synthase-1